MRDLKKFLFVAEIIISQVSKDTAILNRDITIHEVLKKKNTQCLLS